jgi:hypothetical protein
MGLFSRGEFMYIAIISMYEWKIAGDRGTVGDMGREGTWKCPLLGVSGTLGKPLVANCD